MGIKIVGINHVSLWVKDVQKSIDFYHGKLGFPLIPRPAFDFNGAWFAIGDTQQLHILEGRYIDTAHSHSRRNHFAVEVENLTYTEAFLRKCNITYIGPKPRPDGVMQIFIQDPDGYWVEFTQLR